MGVTDFLRGTRASQNALPLTSQTLNCTAHYYVDHNTAQVDYSFCARSLLAMARNGMKSGAMACNAVQ
jgi:hypothetical protein